MRTSFTPSHSANESRPTPQFLRSGRHGHILGNICQLPASKITGEKLTLAVKFATTNGWLLVMRKSKVVSPIGSSTGRHLRRSVRKELMQKAPSFATTC
jgi:hypothetical protein